MNTGTSAVRLVLDLEPALAEALAQFLKRAGYLDFREKAASEGEAYQMQLGCDRLRGALASAGIEPR
ncbi:hypothetical protein PQR12_11605 [Paraburkholderia nemoris]|uniref:DUF7706 family protein n=1 Tax=Paraburkholderia nemoris TaxID=2793076 RepID=UPI0038BB1CE4